MCVVVAMSQSSGVPQGVVELCVGLCSWSEPCLIECKRFFPPACKDKLAHYAKVLPCVEVDTSSYAIPTNKRTGEWVKSTPSDFVFHYKLLHLLSLRAQSFSSLPWRVKEILEIEKGSTYSSEELCYYRTLSREAKNMLWRCVRESLAPIQERNQLGVIIVQFPRTFVHTEPSNVLYLEELLNELKDFRVALEMRTAEWFSIRESHPDIYEKLYRILASHGKSCLVYVDDDAIINGRQLPLPPKEPDPLFVAPTFMYSRIHRRSGEYRVLPAEQVAEWHDRIQHWKERVRENLPSGETGFVFLLISTAAEDHSIVNADNLGAPFPEHKGYAQKIKQQSIKRGIGAFFSSKSSAGPSLSTPVSSSSSSAGTAPSATSSSAATSSVATVIDLVGDQEEEEKETSSGMAGGQRTASDPTASLEDGSPSTKRRNTGSPKSPAPQRSKSGGKPSSAGPSTASRNFMSQFLKQPK